MKAWINTCILAVVAMSIAGCAAMLGEPTEAEKLNHATALAKADAARAEVARAEANAEASRYRALSELSKAKTNTPAVTAGVMGLTIEGIVKQAKGAPAAQSVVIKPPERRNGFWDYALGFANIGVQAYGIKEGAATQRAISRDNRDIQLGIVGGYTEMASYIQAPAANVQTSYTMGGNGVLGDGTYTDVRTASGAGASTAGAASYAPVDDHSWWTTDYHGTDNHATTWTQIP